MSETRDRAETARTANRLYWNSSDSVGAIAARLGVPRSALYASVRPLPAGERCPECGGELYFANRSARAAGSTGCSACGAEHQIEPERAERHEEATSPRGERTRRRAVVRERPSELADRTVVCGAGALLGIFLGAAVGGLVRRRRRVRAAL